MSNPVCHCGHTYSQHPEGSSPTHFYRVARAALTYALSQAVYWPGISDRHRLAIARARRERSEAAA